MSCENVPCPLCGSCKYYIYKEFESLPHQCNTTLSSTANSQVRGYNNRTLGKCSEYSPFSRTMSDFQQSQQFESTDQGNFDDEGDRNQPKYQRPVQAHPQSRSDGEISELMRILIKKNPSFILLTKPITWIVLLGVAVIYLLFFRG